MNDSATPWRALEEPAHSAAAAPAETGSGHALGRPGMAGVPVIALIFGAAGIVAAIALWVVLAGGRGTLVVDGSGPGPVRSAGDRGVADTRPTASHAELVVDVQGAVVRPGIVRLAAGARVADAIAAAGGYGPRVAADRIGQALNLAALVKDGDQVVVPSRDDSNAGRSPGGGGGSGGSSGDGSPGSAGPVDLNQATAAELDALPGIGPVTAAKIIAAREEQPFTSVDDLKTRKILGPSTFDKVKALVVVR
jgi:competence protein ComEA